MNITELMQKSLALNKAKGFVVPGVPVDIPKRLLQIVGECTEALESINQGRMEPNWIEISNKFNRGTDFPEVFEVEIKNTFPDEIADIVIRAASLAAEIGIDLQEHILLKLKYNETRPHKHGKQF